MYNKIVHCHSLTDIDGKWKCIVVNAYFANEPLLNLENDPFQEYDLAIIANINQTINGTLQLLARRRDKT